MKRFLLLSIGLSFATAGQLLALSGGPFDNGYSSSRLEDGAVYQAVLSYNNGNGFSYFHPEQNIVSENLTTQFAFNARGSLSNRTVLYYKGITYVGTAFGMTDVESRYIQCTINASSDLSNTTTANSANNNNNNNNSASQTAATNIGLAIVSNNRGFLANGQWEAKMNKMAPTRRFFGRGEIVFLAPTGADAVAGLAYQGYSGLINAIVQAVGGLGDDFNASIFGNAQTAINNSLNALPAFLAGAGLDTVVKAGDTVKVGVRGTLRYL